MSIMRGSLLFLMTAAALRPQVAPDQPVIRVTTRLAEVSVIARDARGSAADLTASDFKVFDNGREIPIAFFSVNSVSQAKAFRPLPANVFTNRPEQRSDAPSRLSIVLLDGLNTQFADQAYARQQIQKYVHDVGPRDRIAIYALGGTSLRLVQDFTNDQKLLSAALDRQWPSIWLAPNLPPEIANRGTAANEGEAMANSMQAMAGGVVTMYRARVTTDVMRDLATQLARIPGRKSLIWLSAGFPLELSIGSQPFDTLSFRGELSGAGRALAKGNIAIYPVDAGGLVAPSGGKSVIGLSAAEANRHSTLDMLAEATGGRAFYNSNDVTGEIRQAVDDSSVAYNIGFYPGEEDGRYHRLEITTSRPGVTLRYRKGYLSTDPQIQTAQVEDRDAIQNALWSPIDATGIQFDVRMEKPDRAKPDFIRMSIGISSRELALQKQADGRLGKVQLIIGQHSADGRELTTVAELVEVDPSRQRTESILESGVVLRREVHAAPGAATIRIVMFDPQSGRIGSLEIPAKAAGLSPGAL